MDEDVLAVSDVTQGSHGAVGINSDNTVTYTPNAGFGGVDSFTYTANDGNGGTDEGRVTVTVSSVNDPPVAVDDKYGTDEDKPLSVAAPGVLENDRDPDGDVLTAVLVSSSDNGRVTLNSDGSFKYMPGENFSGVDTFTYRAEDRPLLNAQSLTANGSVATVVIKVSPVNDAPVVLDIPDQRIQLEESPSALMAGQRAGYVTIALDEYVGDPDNADTEMIWTYEGNVELTVTVSAERVATIGIPSPTWSGSETITFTATDPTGAADSDAATFTVTVAPASVVCKTVFQPNRWSQAWTNSRSILSRGSVRAYIGFGGEEMEIRARDLVEGALFGPFEVTQVRTRRIGRSERIVAVVLAYSGSDRVDITARNLIKTWSLEDVEPGDRIELAYGRWGFFFGKISLVVGAGSRSVRDIDLESILLNDQVSPQTCRSGRSRTEKLCSRIVRLYPGFLGEVLEVRFGKSDAFESLGAVNGGDIVLATITGSFTDGQAFSASGSVHVVMRSLAKTVAIDDGTPDTYSLDQNYPNPFNPETTIEGTIAEAGAVQLSIYTTNGQLVRTLLDGERPAGSYSLVWDGRNDAGREVASGVYLCRMIVGNYRAVRKMLLVR